MNIHQDISNADSVPIVVLHDSLNTLCIPRLLERLGATILGQTHTAICTTFHSLRSCMLNGMVDMHMGTRTGTHPTLCVHIEWSPRDTFLLDFLLQ